jgi:RNA polymerase sigma-70 factor (ECF subfamily)
MPRKESGQDGVFSIVRAQPLSTRPELRVISQLPVPTPAFEEVLAAHLDTLWRTALRLCRGHDADAEDLMQETALRAQQGYGQLRATEAAKSWLLTIMTRQHLNRIRSRKRRPEWSAADLATTEFEQMLAEAEPHLGTERLVEQAALREALAEALDSLPDEMRMAVWLVDAEGLSMREAAEAMAVPEGTVASRLFRGRRQLRVILEEVR